jgi:hypothetical protein
MMGVLVEIHELHPSGAKAQVRFAPFAARLKSCPFKVESFSSGAKAQADFGAFAARLKSCPDTNQHSGINRRSSGAWLALPAIWMAQQFFRFPAAFPPQVSQAKTMKRGLYV